MLVVPVFIPCSQPSLYISTLPVSAWGETKAGPSWTVGGGWLERLGRLVAPSALPVSVKGTISGLGVPTWH